MHIYACMHAMHKHMFSIHSPPKELHIKFQHSSMSEVLFIIGGHNVPPPRANRYSQTLGLVGLKESVFTQNTECISGIFGIFYLKKSSDASHSYGKYWNF